MKTMDIELPQRCGFLWLRKCTVTYRGWCTVWHKLDTGKRASGSTEARLSDIWWKRTEGKNG